MTDFLHRSRHFERIDLSGLGKLNLPCYPASTTHLSFQPEGDDGRHGGIMIMIMIIIFIIIIIIIIIIIRWRWEAWQDWQAKLMNRSVSDDHKED